MIISAILQWQVYETSPCGYHATECAVGSGVSPIVSSLPYFSGHVLNATSRLGRSFPSVSPKPSGSSAMYLCDTDWLQPMGGILISVTCEFSLSFRAPSN